MYENKNGNIEKRGSINQTIYGICELKIKRYLEA